MDISMSRPQWEVKGILTHVVHCKQYSDLCRDCSMMHWNSPGTLTQSQDISDLLCIPWPDWPTQADLMVLLAILFYSYSSAALKSNLLHLYVASLVNTLALLQAHVLKAYLCGWKLPQTQTTVPHTGYFKQEKSSLFFFFFLVTEVWETQVTVLKIYIMIYLLVLLAKKKTCQQK